MLRDLTFNNSDLSPSLNSQISRFSKEYQGVALACSGGPDSVALFHILYQLLKEKKIFSLALVHINFGLRGKESWEDEKFVESLARKYGLPYFVKSPSNEEFSNRKIKNVQNWARTYRYKVFSQLADKGWLVALGHTRDDVVENIIMRMARGVGPASLMGMSVFNPPFWRPLLEVPKKDLLAWLTHYEITYRNDSSNKQLKYSRNVVRHKIVPELEKIYPQHKRKYIAVQKSV